MNLPNPIAMGLRLCLTVGPRQYVRMDGLKGHPAIDLHGRLFSSGKPAIIRSCSFRQPLPR